MSWDDCLICRLQVNDDEIVAGTADVVFALYEPGRGRRVATFHFSCLEASDEFTVIGLDDPELESYGVVVNGSDAIS